MGNGDSKGGSVSPETLKNQAVFKSFSKNRGLLCRQDLEAAWNDKADQRLKNMTLNLLFSKENGLNFETYDNFATNIMRGNYPSKADVILELIGTGSSGDDRQLNELVSAIICSVMKWEHKKSSKAFVSWSGEAVKNRDFVRLTEYCVSLAGGSKAEYTNQDICAMLPFLETFVSCVFSPLLGSNELSNSFFPRWMRLQGDAGKELQRCSILSLEDILFLNVELPVDWQSEWRLLFSTKIHGESFSRLSGQIVNQGPTLIVIRDKGDHVFGGFAPANWTLNPNYVGDPSCFVFSLRPCMNIYSASNFNANFQYLNQGQQTLPNGLGMGGRLEYFGLWLDSEFGKGLCNDSCTTFRNFARLSKEREFLCSDVEVWGVGQPPPSSADLGERSVLDGNTEAQAILEMAGRKTYSEGLREKPKD